MPISAEGCVPAALPWCELPAHELLTRLAIPCIPPHLKA